MMKRRIGVVLTAAALSLTLIIPALAASAAPTSVDEAAQVVNALGIIVGDSSGNMNLTQRVTRAEFITMAVKATSGGDQVGQAATSPYPDVPWKHWASGYVEAGVAAKLITGYSDGTFRPSNSINLAEGATIVLQLLGYGPVDFSGAYPTGQLAMYRSLKLDRGVSASTAASPLTRQDAMYLFYNLMTAKNKEGKVYLETLGHSLNDTGEIDLVALINNAMEGPIVAQGDWKEAVRFTLSSTKIYREGKASSLSAIQSQDVVYWNRAMNAIWVYGDRITGTIQALEPSSANPNSVTVAGRTCKIETAVAAYALSDLGQYSLGDTVTLLLGRNGGVAAVTDGDSSSGSSVSTEQIGVVTAIENNSYSDGKGGTYTARTAVLLATDGRTYRYESKSGLKAGSLVRVTVSDQSGGVTLHSISTASLSGKVNTAGTKAGNYTFAQGVEILDVSDGYGVRVYPGRLAGVILSGGMVKYYSLNANGEIDRMILNDVTSDMYLYGVLTDMTSQDGGELNTYYSYQFQLGGTAGSISQTTIRYPVSLGGIRVKGTAQVPEKMYSLTSAKTGEVSGNQFVTGERKYTLADNVIVYEVRNGNYYLSTLARIKSGNFILTGWYDKADVDGGRLRVISAKEQ